MLMDQSVGQLRNTAPQMISLAEEIMLRWMSGNTLRDKRRNESILKKFEVVLTMREIQFRWFGHVHVQQRLVRAPVMRGQDYS